MHITRFAMYKNIFQLFPDGLDGKILGISGIQNYYPLIKHKKDIVHANFPKIDMQNLPFKTASFDYVISDQIIEHLENPWKAVKESYRVLKKGGIAIHTTCLLMPIHPCPKDYWRFTPDALKLLCEDFSNIIDVGSHGNKIIVIAPYIWGKLRYTPIWDNKLNPLYWIAMYNNRVFPVSTWIVAQK